MTRLQKFFLSAAGSIMMLASCTQMQQQQTPPPPPAPTFIPGTFEHFCYTTPEYPATMTIFRNEELLRSATSKSPIYICLSQQRGRLYVNGQVAADWPVSTGVNGHETPTGKFRISQKERKYASNRYGKMYNAEGKCIDRDADAFKDVIPEGGKFVGSPMPNWMRLTSDGVGMHTGKVRAGKRLSHGCIRTPNSMARQLFDITARGTRVTITDGREQAFPLLAVDAMNRAAAEEAMRKAEEAAAAAEAAAEQQS